MEGGEYRRRSAKQNEDFADIRKLLCGQLTMKLQPRFDSLKLAPLVLRKKYWKKKQGKRIEGSHCPSHGYHRISIAGPQVPESRSAERRLFDGRRRRYPINPFNISTECCARCTATGSGGRRASRAAASHLISGSRAANEYMPSTARGHASEPTGGSPGLALLRAAAQVVLMSEDGVQM
jgi:hypothetical protein